MIFIHVMKTGGTTLIQHLRNNLAPEEFYPHPDIDLMVESSGQVKTRHLTMPYLRRLPEERRRRIRVYSGHFPYLITEEFDPPARTMTILREPVDRTISLLRQWSRNRPQLSLSLEDVYELPEIYERLVHDHQTKVFSITAEDHPRGYMHPIHVDRERLALAKANLATVDLIGVTEAYDDFLDLVVDRFGWRVKREVRANTSPPDNELPASDELRRRIADDNAIDLEFYEYATQLIAARRIAGSSDA